MSNIDNVTGDPTPPKMRRKGCKACRQVGAWHCGTPEDCGSFDETLEEAPSIPEASVAPIEVAIERDTARNQIRQVGLNARRAPIEVGV